MEDKPTPYDDSVEVPTRVQDLSRRVIGLAIDVHRALGLRDLVIFVNQTL